MRYDHDLLMAMMAKRPQKACILDASHIPRRPFIMRYDHYSRGPRQWRADISWHRTHSDHIIYATVTR